MKPVLNKQTLLWIIGVLQPVSADELKGYLDTVFDEVGHLPDIPKIHKFCMAQEKMGRLIRVERNPDLFSLTSKASNALSKQHSTLATKLAFTC